MPLPIRGVLVACLFLPMGLACSSEKNSDGPGDIKAGFTWTPAAPCPVARFEATGVVLGDEGWVMGGFTAATLAVTRRSDIYAPATDTWRTGPDLPGAETHMAAVTVGSDIIVAGGFSGSFEGGRPPPTEAVSRWNAGSSEWSYEASLPTRGAAFHWALLGTE